MTQELAVFLLLLNINN